MNDLAEPDLFKRFHNHQKHGDNIGALTAALPVLEKSTNRSFNREMLELIHTTLIRKKFGRPEDSLVFIREFPCLLKAYDSEVRLMTADNIGLFKFESADSVLLGSLDDVDSQVRRFAYRSMMALKSPLGLKRAKRAVVEDPAEDVRRLALAYLGTVDRKEEVAPILIERLQNDSSASVKVISAEFIAENEDSSAIPVLLEATGYYDVYVQRAAAKALCRMGRIEGIETLISSLSFRSIDAFYNYDYNVPNFIATYAGYDLPDSTRYRQSAWEEWFAKNRKKIDVRKNAKAEKSFNDLNVTLNGIEDNLKIAQLETFLKKYPGHRRAAGSLAEILNRLAWDMATAPAGSERANPVLAVKYAKRTVELVANAGYFDTLAEAYLSAGKIEESENLCQEQLKLNPGEKMFLDRLERIKKMKK